jgi:hypothetical protein
MVRQPVFALALAISACSSSSGDPVAPTGAPEPKPTAVPTASTASTSDAAVDPNASRELSATDCRALAGKYNALTRSDEMAKLPAGLTPEQVAVAARQLEAGAEILSTRWENGCVESLVGKESPEANLKCAMSAKTVAAFDVCLNGPSEPPPDATAPKR